MASVVINPSPKLNLSSMETIQEERLGSINNTNYYKSEVSTFLPFRIRFTNIGIGSYGPGDPAPIGIAIIGVNNYIL